MPVEGLCAQVYQQPAVRGLVALTAWLPVAGRTRTGRSLPGSEWANSFIPAHWADCIDVDGPLSQGAPFPACQWADAGAVGRRPGTGRGRAASAPVPGREKRLRRGAWCRRRGRPRCHLPGATGLPQHLTSAGKLSLHRRILLALGNLTGALASKSNRLVKSLSIDLPQTSLDYGDSSPPQGAPLQHIQVQHPVH